MLFYTLTFNHIIPNKADDLQTKAKLMHGAEHEWVVGQWHKAQFWVQQSH